MDEPQTQATSDPLNISNSPPNILFSVLGSFKPHLDPDNPKRPYVTLTFAQSLDAKIAGHGGKQLILSGKESMVMTHWMRTMHDAILIGIGTAINDDPQLNTRHLPPSPDDTGAQGFNRHHLPRPVILDSQLKLPLTCKLLANFKAGNGRRPWVVSSSPGVSEAADCRSSNQSEWASRRTALEAAGARVLDVLAHNGLLCIPAVLECLREAGIRSVMVEGGARVIGSFMAETSKSEHDSTVIDAVIVTVAPKYVGEDGIGCGIGTAGQSIPKLVHLRTENIGRDSVFAFIVQ